MGRKSISATSEDSTWKPCKIDNKKELTIIDAIEQVVTLVRDSQFCTAFFRAAKRPLEYLSERLSLTQDQAALFSVLVNFSNDSRIKLSDITEFVNCSQIEILRRATDLNELKRLHFIDRRDTSHWGEIYYVTSTALNAIKKNTTFEPPQTSNLTLTQFLDLTGQYIEQYENEMCEYYEFRDNIKELLEKNGNLPFIKKLKSFNLSEVSIIAFLQGCNMFVNNDDEIIAYNNINFLFRHRYEARDLFIKLNKGDHQLIKLELFQPYGDDLARKDVFKLGRVAIEDLLAELNLSIKEIDTIQNRLDYKNICAKQLFYNPREEEQINQLQSLLQPARFEKICDKLSANGMRRGFAVLFYGAPGTGKTETALQLARITGRDIIQVNVSELRDKFVGESEKRVKALFDNYRKIVKNSKIAPILLFNEADAIISKRNGNVVHAVDKMENALQNIILQEIENLEGILIATTNLTNNMDRAFERRFLYKVEFNVPTIAAKRAIWKSMLPSLSDDDATKLAATYNFSGGQIENIARKYTVSQILSERDDIPFEQIQSMCDDELLDKTPTRRVVGF